VTTCADPKLLLRATTGGGGLTGTFLGRPRFKLYGRSRRVEQRTTGSPGANNRPTALCGERCDGHAGGWCSTPSHGNLQAYDAANGDLLWQVSNGVRRGEPDCAVNGGGPVMTFEAGGEQYVVDDDKIVWAFKLGGTVPPRPAPPAPFTVSPWERTDRRHGQDRVDDHRRADDSHRQPSRERQRLVHLHRRAAHVALARPSRSSNGKADTPSRARDGSVDDGPYQAWRLGDGHHRQTR